MNTAVNSLDIIVLVILVACILYGCIKGFAESMLNFFSFIIAIALTNFLYPHVGKFLRGVDGFYDALKLSVTETLGLDELIKTTSKAAEVDIINSLPLPVFMRDSLIENNNSVIYESIKATGITDYIAGFVASIMLNVISMAIVFIIAYIGMKLLSAAIKIITKVPIISSFNKLLGGVVGALEGVLAIWIVLAVLVIFCATNEAFPVLALLDTSTVAKWFYDTNFILNFFARFFP